MKLLLVLCAVVGLCAAEAPLSGPYPHSGWKPQGTQFFLPGQFQPELNQDQNEERNVEITQEPVNFAGQTTETEEAKAEPNNAYLPPSDTDFQDETIEENTEALKVQGAEQGLPSEEDSQQFTEPESDNQISGQYRQFGRLRQQPIQRNYNINRQQQQQQFGRLVKQQPYFQRFQQPRQQFQFARQEAAAAPPSQKYGQPRNVPLPESEEQQDSVEEEQPSITVSNAIQSGRYYVLSPDNTLQRVNYQTTQDEEEARNKGFTAQLKYQPVEPIRDPIYAYNEQGVLVRIYRRK